MIILPPEYSTYLYEFSRNKSYVLRLRLYLGLVGFNKFLIFEYSTIYEENIFDFSKRCHK